LALSREMRDGERVLWRGTPTGRLKLWSFAIYVFAIPWTAFSLFWTTMAFAGMGATEWEGEGSIFKWAIPLFGLPFIIVGLAMMAGPFLPKWQRDKVLYAVTSERVLKLHLWRQLEVTFCPLDRIGHVIRRERPDGSGSLSLAIKVGKDSDGDPSVERFIIDEVHGVIDANDAIEHMTRPN
jgi:hypothetical protein